ncbi:hypothetical protein [Thalassospira sp.]|uniref:hypothetical protein n=1 Tax=Thalassospira sp. TaxID=1912094 RepID=UPI002735AD1A|nr:hypothetical protein [Thalassospira sp.]MDP2698875.1 hypothetical protein [Thalassospira sp.]
MTMKPDLPKPARSGDGKTIVKFMLGHMLYGGFGAVVFGVLVLYFDIASLRTLLSTSPDAPLLVFMLFFGLFVTFGSIAIGIGVMNLGSFSDNDEYRDERRED